MFDIAKIINEDYIYKLFGEKRLIYFPDLKDSTIENVEIERINPYWAKETILAKYKIFFSNGRAKFLRGSAAQNGSKTSCWRIMKYLEHRAFGIARPVDYIAESNFLLYEEVAGRPLSSTIADKDSQTEKLLRKTANWLSDLHALEHQELNLQPAMMTNATDYEQAFKKIAEFFPALKNERLPETGISDIGEIASQRETLIHGDFYPNNIISDTAGQIYAIDFDRSGLGPRLIDPAAQIFWLRFYCPRENAADYEKIFLATYCDEQKLEYSQIVKKLNKYLAKICLDQMVYFINICSKGWSFFQAAEKNQTGEKIRTLLNMAKSYFDQIES